MNKWLLIAVVLAGCQTYSDTAKEMCADHGGVKSFVRSTTTGQIDARCRDGSFACARPKGGTVRCSPDRESA